MVGVSQPQKTGTGLKSAITPYGIRLFGTFEKIAFL